MHARDVDFATLRSVVEPLSDYLRPGRETIGCIMPHLR
jgi:hypothetical protein